MLRRQARILALVFVARRREVVNTGDARLVRRTLETAEDDGRIEAPGEIVRNRSVHRCPRMHRLFHGLTDNHRRLRRVDDASASGQLGRSPQQRVLDIATREAGTFSALQLMHLVQSRLANLERRVRQHRGNEFPVDREREQPERNARLDFREDHGDASVASDVARQPTARIPDDPHSLVRALAQNRDVSTPVALDQVLAA